MEDLLCVSLIGAGFVSIVLASKTPFEPRFLDFDVVLGFEMDGLVALGTMSGKLFRYVFLPPIKCSEHTMIFLKAHECLCDSRDLSISYVVLFLFAFTIRKTIPTQVHIPFRIVGSFWNCTCIFSSRF